MKPTVNVARLPLYERFWMKVQIVPNESSCWEWLAGKNDKGYGTIQDGDGYEIASRASYRFAYGEIPEGAHVLHACDNPGCVRPSHLFPGSHADNMLDMAQKGRFNGSRGVRFTPFEVGMIRHLAREGVRNSEIALRFRAHPSTISSIVHRHTWKHLP